MTTFQDLPLSEHLQRALREMGFEKPSPIQAETLPLLLGQRTDFLGLAATGTGKTAAFALPMLERIDTKKRKVQALVLCPTRELAIQVAGQIDLLGKYLGLRALPIYGGVGYRDQFVGLERGAQIVVGTPGRIVDHMDKGSLRLDELETLILDEADEMISMGFKDDLERVLGSVPEGQANTWLFSATMGSDVRHVADRYLHEPQKVQINRQEVLSATVEQLYYLVHEYDKPEVLCKLIDAADDFFGIVFCQTKSLTTDLVQYLKGRGYKADALQGDLTQDQRDRVMRAFRDRAINILVATDVACRGLDVKDVTHVVNYSLPRELDSYVHRIGRTARSGKEGLALSLVTKSHRGLIARIEQMTKSRMTEGKIPTRKEIAAKKVARLLPAFEATSNVDRALSLVNDAWKLAIADKNPEEITARFLTLLYPDLFIDREPGTRAMKDSRPEGQEPENRRDRRRREKHEREDRHPGRPPERQDASPVMVAARMAAEQDDSELPAELQEQETRDVAEEQDGEDAAASADHAGTESSASPREEALPVGFENAPAPREWKQKKRDFRPRGGPGGGKPRFRDRGGFGGGRKPGGFGGRRFEQRESREGGSDRPDRRTPPWERKQSSFRPWGQQHEKPGQRWKRERGGEETAQRDFAEQQKRSESGGWKTRGTRPESAPVRPWARQGGEKPFHKSKKKIGGWGRLPK